MIKVYLESKDEKLNEITLDEFYKFFPYHNPDYNSDYWKQQHNKWKEIWKQV